MATTISFAGEYDLTDQREFKSKLAAAQAEHEVIVDFTNVSYVDSACIMELLLFSRTRRERGLPPETIFVTAGPVAKVLEVSGVAKVCRVVTQAR
ncbi:MAG TPA: STAS domain-containing protein [Candidatus Baltobacteraceae bacterium]|jgi:anti-anti-sigma factor